MMDLRKTTSHPEHAAAPYRVEITLGLLQIKQQLVAISTEEVEEGGDGEDSGESRERSGEFILTEDSEHDIVYGYGPLTSFPTLRLSLDVLPPNMCRHLLRQSPEQNERPEIR